MARRSSTADDATIRWITVPRTVQLRRRVELIPATEAADDETEHGASRAERESERKR